MYFLLYGFWQYYIAGFLVHYHLCVFLLFHPICLVIGDNQNVLYTAGSRSLLPKLKKGIEPEVLLAITLRLITHIKNKSKYLCEIIQCVNMSIS